MPKWGGQCTKDGKHGLYAPGRGGLELIELKHGKSVRTYIPKVRIAIYVHTLLDLMAFAIASCYYGMRVIK